MKKQLHKLIFSLIVCTYVFSAVGIKIVAHYCGGELEKIALFSKPSSCCGDDEEMAEDDGCCKNDSQHLILKSDFTFFTLISDYKAIVTNLFFLPNNIELIHFKETAQSLILINKKERPPNFIQSIIVSTSNLRI